MTCDQHTLHWNHKKVTYFTKILYLFFTGICFLDYIWVYIIITGALAIEHIMLIRSHFGALDKLCDKKYEGSRIQRQILGFSAFNSAFWGLVTLLSLLNIRYRAYLFLGYTPDFTNYFNDPVVLAYTLLKLNLMYSTLDRIHNFLILRSYWAFQTYMPPITRTIKTLVDRLRRQE